MAHEMSLTLTTKLFLGSLRASRAIKNGVAKGVASDPHDTTIEYRSHHYTKLPSSLRSALASSACSQFSSLLVQISQSNRVASIRQSLALVQDQHISAVFESSIEVLVQALESKKFSYSCQLNHNKTVDDTSQVLYLF